MAISPSACEFHCRSVSTRLWQVHGFFLITMLLFSSLAGCITPEPKLKGWPVPLPPAIPKAELSESSPSPQLRSLSTPDESTHLLLAASLPRRSAIVQLAASLVGAQTITRAGKTIAYDCAGVTRAIFLEHGIDLYRGDGPNPNSNGVRLIYNHVRHHGVLHQGSDVHPGDLVFFDNTWDFNGDGQPNDPLTHVGIVERLESNGTVVFISRVAGAIERYRMNLEQPHLHKNAQGHVLNDYLRRKRPTDPAQTARLTGELFASYGNLLSPQKYTSFDGPLTHNQRQPRAVVSPVSPLSE